ncbi:MULTISPECIES: neutral zinc metallopeptidase [unclassified Photobacterium]|uniref:KPN_02809 family neutral zinc metallopeptidase n=1 Tax=unclassified Photobacterium TaxID=2628852 RepID=UPI001EDCBF8D|nr:MULTISPECIES: neutral zinc metallopeptidase [unclassified Photobacterium]MCG3864141.1 neutral zinc metallopeptidase [Photobacterium sp. Ph6]MCG3875671.1 neutral zinc metallopeptidase [Photobacterium sp. Ph5]
MRWKNSRQSTNIEDRRGQSPTQAGLPIGGLLRFIPFLIKTKIGRIILVVGGLFLAYQHFTGGNMMGLQQSAPSSQLATQNDENKQFVAAVLGTTETVWNKILNGKYQPPKLVLYNNVTQTGCGTGSAQSGPFYCPTDKKVYLDLSFMNELKKLGAPGDFAFAYVIAHEVGHHVQNLLGTSTKVHQMQQRSSKVEANRLSVKLELQADCYAGVWGHYVNQQGMLETGDIDEGIKAASAVGDDRLQEMAGQAVQPDAFTHGSSAQRIAWFKKGFETGDPRQCNTFQQ